MEKLDRERADLEPLAEELAGMEASIADQRRLRDEHQRMEGAAEAAELDTLIKSQDKLKAELEKVTGEVEALKDYADFPASKGEQLNNIAGRVEEMSAALAKQEDALKSKVQQPLEGIEQKLQDFKELASATPEELKSFETAHSRLSDRAERLGNAERSVNDSLKSLGGEAFDREKLAKWRETFSQLDERKLRFVEDFRASYAEEEAVFRECRTKREWLERERDLILVRRQRIISNARLFFIIAAVMAIAGGLMMVLTSGGWLGSVLAGLGAVFGAVGFIIRGTAGSADSTGLKTLEIDLEVAEGEEKDARERLDKIGGEMNSIAKSCGFGDGNQLMTEYSEYVQLDRLAEPLFEAERDLERAQADWQQALDGVRPHFDRAGAELPVGEEALALAEELLGRYRDAVKLGEDFKELKAREAQLSEDIERLRRDLKNQQELAEDILKLGGVEKTEPLKDAIKLFSEAHEKHRKYRALADERLPLLKRDALAEVDLKAKRERLKLLSEKTPDWANLKIEHSKEYYRDQAERCLKEIEGLQQKKMDFNRKLGAFLEKYQSNYPGLHADCEELERNIEQVERFKGEVELAVSVMTDISTEVYSAWAAALSESVAPVLKALNPRYTDLRFDDDLSFTILDSQQEKLIHSDDVDRVLSSGARDEVFLAARLGISAYLSRGARGAIPIILDEPLSAVDDEKFLSGMRFFMENLSQKHQVLIMSCHAERHRWLQEQVPELFAERVEVIELNSKQNEA